MSSGDGALRARRITSGFMTILSRTTSGIAIYLPRLLEGVGMRTAGNTILITGGATGIGFSLAKSLCETNRVIICGRRESRLKEARDALPRLETIMCDLTKDRDRQSLFDWATSHFPDLNIVINNAGVQRQIDLRKGLTDFSPGENEITTNLEAPIALTALFVPHLLQKNNAAIVNVTSGLGFTPLAILPLYCATKAAMHSFTLSLRHQLSGTSVKVFELVPPTVDTELDRGARDRREQKDRGIHPDEVARAALLGLANDQFEIVIGAANNLRSNPDKMFNMINH
jgi:uncharacterized oxidoreductase